MWDNGYRPIVDDPNTFLDFIYFSYAAFISKKAPKNDYGPKLRPNVASWPQLGEGGRNVWISLSQFFVPADPGRTTDILLTGAAGPCGWQKKSVAKYKAFNMVGPKT